MCIYIYIAFAPFQVLGLHAYVEIGDTIYYISFSDISDPCMYDALVASFCLQPLVDYGCIPNFVKYSGFYV
ncbi:hypothetical protein HanRHA438_Chr07g0295091 [Helianthus annuus]|nr:hypothetical protein HanRHA438_Chr07g0295091 [Helianthus annuus]